MSDKNVVSQMEATVAIDAITKEQYAVTFEAMQGFVISRQSTAPDISKEFFKVAVEDELAIANYIDNLLVPGDVSGAAIAPEHISVDAPTIYNYLANTQLGHIDDSDSNDAVATHDSSTYPLGTSNVYGTETGGPSTDRAAGHHIVNGIINAALDLNGGNYNALFLNDENVDNMLRQSGEVYGTASSTLSLDRLIADGIVTALEAGTVAEHNDLLVSLLAQLTADEIAADFSGNVTAGTPFGFYKDQNLWMKVNLQVSLNKATSSFWSSPVDSSDSFNVAESAAEEPILFQNINTTFAALAGVSLLQADLTAAASPGQQVDRIDVSVYVKFEVGA